MTNLLLFLCGLVEWFLAAKRLVALSQGRRTLVSSIVFLETLLAVWVLSEVTVSRRLWPVLLYALGSALGAFSAQSRGGRRNDPGIKSNDLGSGSK